LKPLSVIYWTRVCLGIVAGALCVVFGFNNFLNGVSLGLLFYVITNYFLKQLFIAKVEKSSKVLTTGIGAYFLTWIVAWILLFSITVPTAKFIWSPLNPQMRETVTFDASTSTPNFGYIVTYTWDFGDGNISTVSNPIITHHYVTNGTYYVTLTVTDSERKTGATTKTITVAASSRADLTYSPTYELKGRVSAVFKSLYVCIFNCFGSFIFDRTHVYPARRRFKIFSG